MEEQLSKKLSHEAFISGHDGSSPIDIILSVMPIVPGSVLAATFTSTYSPTLFNFTKEYVLCILPLILSFTVLSGSNLELCAIMFFLLLLLPQRPRGMPEIESNAKDKKLPCLTSSRATVNIATIIAILAVDFHIFPRRFAKTEKYGYSLMDVGAACYLFMNGITDSKKKSRTSRGYVKDVLILGSLGLLRIISVKSTNYQEHISEYGVHCNFFFTLLSVKILNMFGFHKMTKIQKTVIVISLAVIHQIALLKGLEQWAMSEESRNGVLLQNKEWFVSLPGNYLTYLAGHLVGDFLPKSNQRYKISTLLPVFPFLVLFVLDIMFGLKPSRRVANLPFIMWIKYDP